MYLPDFRIVYVDKDGKRHCEILEVKPEKEMPGYAGRTDTRTKLVQTINAAKWQAAIAFCAQRGWKFRVATDKQLFQFKRKP